MSTSADGGRNVDQEVLVGTLEQVGKRGDTTAFSNSLSAISNLGASTQSADNIDQDFFGLVVQQRDELLDSVELVESSYVLEVVSALPDGTSSGNEKFLVGRLVKESDERSKTMALTNNVSDFVILGTFEDGTSTVGLEESILGRETFNEELDHASSSNRITVSLCTD